MQRVRESGGSLDVRHAPIATEFCVAEQFRYVPRADVALSAERHSKHELWPDGVGVAVSIASTI
jgi:hypothetical protein